LFKKRKKRKKMKIRATTVIGIRFRNKVAMGSDGQVSVCNTIMKHKTKKVRKLYDDKIMVGFAGASADAFTLFEKFEGMLEKYKGDVQRSAVELAKLRRTDKYLRRLEALLTVMDKNISLIISGTGDVIEPDDNIVAIGSGGPFATAAARAFMQTNTKLTAKEIVIASITIASQICVFTNNNLTVIEL